MIFGRLWGAFWGIAIGLAFIAWIAGSVVSQSVGSNGGHALGQGIKGAFTTIGAIGDGYAEADTVDSQMKAAAAEDRAKKAEARAKKAEQKAQSR